jgi:hypothetical protein
MSREQTAEMWKEFRRRQAVHIKGPVNGSAEALAEWSKEEEALAACRT